MDSQTLDAFRELVKGVARDLYQGKKVKGWSLRSINYYGMGDETVDSDRAERASLSVVSNAKVHNEHYASFHGYCRKGGLTCDVEGISFATTAPSKRGLF